MLDCVEFEGRARLCAPVRRRALLDGFACVAGGWVKDVSKRITGVEADKKAWRRSGHVPHSPSSPCVRSNKGAVHEDDEEAVDPRYVDGTPDCDSEDEELR